MQIRDNFVQWLLCAAFDFNMQIGESDGMKSVNQILKVVLLLGDFRLAHEFMHG